MFNKDSSYNLFFSGTSLKLFREGIGYFTDKLKGFRGPGTLSLENQLNKNERIAAWLDGHIGRATADWDMVLVPIHGEILVLLKSTLPYLLQTEIDKRKELETTRTPQLAFEGIDTRIAKLKELMDVGIMSEVPVEEILGKIVENTEQEVKSDHPLILDEQLKVTVREINEDSPNDRAVDDAVTEIEDRLRKVAGLPETDFGVRLVKKALNPIDGKLILSMVGNEQEGYWKLFDGLLMSHKNVTGHRRTYVSQERALQIVGFADYLLGLLEGARKRDDAEPKQPAPKF